MSTHYLTIDAKHRQNPRLLASIHDFTVRAGDTVDAEIVIKNPNLSLYCLDDDQQRAIFAELPDGIDLSSAPFIYLAQYEAAQRLLAIPYEQFRQIARTLPPIEHLIMIYISGRSGSTLLSHIFNALEHVVSLSEPDVITQFAHLRGDDQTRDAELRELADSAVRLLFNAKRDSHTSSCAIKLRPQGLRAIDLFQASFSDVKNLYSYREVTGYVASFYRILKQFDAPDFVSHDEAIRYYAEQFDYDLTPYMQYLDPDTEAVSIVQFLTLQWLICMEWYLEQAEAGIPVLPIRYQDLKSSGEKVLHGIFEHCDIPAEHVQHTLDVFERDSQAGTPIARKNPNEGNQVRLTDEQMQEIKRILARHPVIQDLEYRVPNTLNV